MRARSNFRLPAILCLAILPLTFSSPASTQAVAKKPLTYAAYDSWRSIQGTVISRDGDWVAYALVPGDGDGELVVRSLKTDAEVRHPRGRNPEIAADSRHVVFTIMPARADVDKAKKEKKPADQQPKNGLGIIELPSGRVTTVERVKSFKLPVDSGKVLAYQLEAVPKPPESKTAETKPAESKPAAPDEVDQARRRRQGLPTGPAPAPGTTPKKEPGTELVVRDLATAAETKLSEVAEYVWSKSGNWLSYTVSSAKTENDGAFARSSADGKTTILMAGAGNYKRLTFDEKGDQVAFVSDKETFKSDPPIYRLYHWKAGSEPAIDLVSGATPTMPKGMVVSENGSLTFSKDGQRLFLGIAPAPKPKPKDPPETVNVDLWSWNDLDLQPMQKVNADSERKRSYLAVVHLKDRRLVPLGGPDLPGVSTTDDPAHTTASTDIPYRPMVSWDDRYADQYLVDLKDGSRTKVLERSRQPASLSPDGKYVYWFDVNDGQWYARGMHEAKAKCLTAKLGVKFSSETWDTPALPASYGIAGWTEGDRNVLIYDRYDIWEVKPDGGGGRMATQGVGRANGLVFRYAALDPEEKTVPRDKPLLLRTVDNRTKSTGFYRLSLNSSDPPAKIVMLEKAVGGFLTKAKNADRVVYSQERFDEFPDLWTSDLSFSSSRKISDANPQKGLYRWGKSELIDYRSNDGKLRQAVLMRPEDFDPTKKYPLLVYIYEERSSSLHRFVNPAPLTAPNFTRYVSNGYIVLQPDITYETGYPGESALKCVIPAVQNLLDRGWIDPARIGISGHSWGAYQIAYLITRTNLFRCVEAGAAVSDMISAYGGIRWETGMSRAFQYEKTQSRIGGPPWEKPLQYIENSPIFWVDKVKTPYLTIHNDEDGAVPWYQGIEFFTALRRLGKEAYLFNYNGEAHNLRNRTNMKHWTVHMDEFFDHYLLGKPRPEWMDKGVPYLDRGRRDIAPLYKACGAAN